MLVFIDESGDAGFKLDGGSSQLFVMCLVCFASSAAARNAEQAISGVAARSGHKSEFKFTSCRDVVKDAFFEHLSAEDFGVQALIVDKRQVRSERLRSINERFYGNIIKQLLGQSLPRLLNADIVIDGSASREYRSELRSAIRAHLPNGTVASTRLKNSKNDRLLQLADMCVGAIHRAKRDDHRQNSRWLAKIEPKIKQLMWF